MIKRISG
jgi:hypothetical protein